MKNQASVAELMELIATAERTAKRIMQSGWPQHQVWPPFRKSRRGGIAIDTDGNMIGKGVFLYITGSGPWLGEDGALYVQTGSSGTRFCRRTLDYLELSYTSARVREVVDHLNVLEY